MMSPGHVAYEAYALALGIEKPWMYLTERERGAWEAAASALQGD